MKNLNSKYKAFGRCFYPALSSYLFYEKWNDISQWSQWPNGSLTAVGNVASLTPMPFNAYIYSNNHAFVKPLNWCVEYNAYIEDAAANGPYFEYVDGASNGFAFKGGNIIIIDHGSVIKTLPYAQPVDQWLNIKMEIRGDEQKLFIGGVLVDTSVLSAIASPVYLYVFTTSLLYLKTISAYVL
jgi:hypothetical protein